MFCCFAWIGFFVLGGIVGHFVIRSGAPLIISVFAAGQAIYFCLFIWAMNMWMVGRLIEGVGSQHYWCSVYHALELRIRLASFSSLLYRRWFFGVTYILSALLFATFIYRIWVSAIKESFRRSRASVRIYVWREFYWRVSMWPLSSSLSSGSGCGFSSEGWPYFQLVRQRH